MNELDQIAYRAPRFPFLYPTMEAGAKAAKLQDLVRMDEATSQTPADNRDVAVATVHARQDIVILVSWQSAIHSQLVNISRGVWAAVIIIVLVLGNRSAG